MFKVFGSYAGDRRLTASGYLRVQSGTPWAARGTRLGGRGAELSRAGRQPSQPDVDEPRSDGRVSPADGRPCSVSVEARLLNVFDNQTRLSTDAQQYLDLRKTTAPPYFAPYLEPNPFFALGNGFAPPRRLHLAAIVSF